MGIVILLLTIGAVVYFVFVRDPKVLRERYKGRTPEQKKVIRYFYYAGRGCLKGTIKDEEYDAMVMTRAKMDSRQMAINKIGLDESQLKEIDPVHFEGYYFNDKSSHDWYWGKDKRLRTNIYEISWLFFSSTQVYIYRYSFNMEDDTKKENTEEYFYKDITNFSTTSDTVERQQPVKFNWRGEMTKYRRVNVDYSRFRLVVPGDSIYCAIDTDSADLEKAIQGMKSLLREKKNA